MNELTAAQEIGRSNALMAIDQWNEVAADAAEHFGNYEDNVDLTTQFMSDADVKAAYWAFQNTLDERADIVTAIRGY